jgi:CheY-like chemotaxis protein
LGDKIGRPAFVGAYDGSFNSLAITKVELPMAQAFMSYASKDAIFADLARMKLKEAGVQVWIDHGGLRAGEEWRKAIDEGISSSDVLLVMITPQSCESPYVTYEWAFAIGKGIKVIPLLLEAADIHPRLAVLQYLDFRNHRTGPWEELIREIVKHTATSKATDALAYVRDMTVDQLQDLIGGTVSLAMATAKSSGHGATPDDISRAAKSVVGVMQHAKETASTSSTQPRRKHILWVDDRPDNNIHERAAFEAMGVNFNLALSTNEALQMLSDERFDAIISDMGRREGPREGYVLLDAVRSRGDKTPFFIYAGSNAPKHKREAAEHGAQGCTNDPQELFELVTQSIT